jgi:hypothetical protein
MCVFITTVYFSRVTIQMQTYIQKCWCRQWVCSKNQRDSISPVFFQLPRGITVVRSHKRLTPLLQTERNLIGEKGTPATPQFHWAQKVLASLLRPATFIFRRRTTAGTIVRLCQGWLAPWYLLYRVYYLLESGGGKINWCTRLPSKKFVIHDTSRTVTRSSIKTKIQKTD